MTTSTAVPAGEGKHFPLVAETQGVDTSSGGVKDLGTQGAGIVPAPESQQKSTTTAGSPVASGSAAAQSTFSGLWLFLIICAVYVTALAIAALIAAKLYQLPGTAGAPPGFLYPQQAPPPTDWPPPGP